MDVTELPTTNLTYYPLNSTNSGNSTTVRSGICYTDYFEQSSSNIIPVPDSINDPNLVGSAAVSRINQRSFRERRRPPPSLPPLPLLPAIGPLDVSGVGKQAMAITTPGSMPSPTKSVMAPSGEKKSLTSSSSSSYSQISSRPRNKKQLGINTQVSTREDFELTGATTKTPLNFQGAEHQKHQKQQIQTPIQPISQARSKAATAHTNTTLSPGTHSNQSNSPGDHHQLPSMFIQPNSYGQVPQIHPVDSYTPSVHSMTTNNTSGGTGFRPLFAKSPTVPSWSIKNLAAHAKFFEEKDVQLKLRMLVHNHHAFEEIIEFGFPAALSDKEEEMLNEVFRELNSNFSDESHCQLDNANYEFDGKVRDNDDVDANSNADDVDDVESMAKDDRSSNSSHSSWQKHFEQQHGEQFKLSTLDTKGMVIENDDSPISKYMTPLNSARSREMTLKITLTPASMRADEDTLYGWQREHLDFGTYKSVGTIFEETDNNNNNDSANSKPSLECPVDEPRSVPAVPTSDVSYIPTGGLGKESSKKVVSKMFGRFKKSKPTPNASIMITSADVQPV